MLMTWTGTEALFADLGHFNRWAIRVNCVVLFPCLARRPVSFHAPLRVWCEAHHYDLWSTDCVPVRGVPLATRHIHWPGVIPVGKRTLMSILYEPGHA